MSDTETNYIYDEILSSLLGASGTEELLSQSGLEHTDIAEMTDMQFSDIVNQIRQTVSEQIHAPLHMLALLTGVILLSALAGNLKNRKTAQIYEVIAVLCAAGTAVSALIDIFSRSAQILEKTADFMLLFSGIFGSILAVSGNLTASAGYQGAMMIVCDVAMEVAVKLLFPFLSMSLAMSLTDAVNPAVSLEGMIKWIQKMTVWILGFLMALFLGFLSVQSVVAVSADKFSTKAVKYTLSGLIPFVGGAVSDAYSAVMGSMGMLRSATGMIGVVSILALLLPVLTELFLYKTLMNVTAAIAELFDTSRLTRLFKNLESVLSVAFSVAVSFFVMFTVSTGIMTALGTAAS